MAPQVDPQVDDVMHLCCELSAYEKIKVTVKHSKKGAVVAGGTALIGGLLAGPIGIAVGGTIGSLVGGWMCRHRFQPLPQILIKLSREEQKKLYSDVMAALGTLTWTDVDDLVALVMSDPTLKKKVIGALSKVTEAKVQH